MGRLFDDLVTGLNEAIDYEKNKKDYLVREFTYTEGDLSKLITASEPNRFQSD